MPHTTTPHHAPAPRKGRARLAVLLAVTLLLGLVNGFAGQRAAWADPGDEGGTPALREKLETASKGYIDAKNALAKSVKRQKQLDKQLKEIEAELAERTGNVREIAAAAYRTGRATTASLLLDSGSPDGFLKRAGMLDILAANEDRHLQELRETQDRQSRARAEIDGEITEQRKQVTVMAKRKDQAEAALAEARTAATQSATYAGPGASSASAQPAPRNPDGSWPSESCSLNDPTTSGCITPRTLHALQQAQDAGFTRYVSCYRNEGSGEHPQGRACDFAAQRNGFGGVAGGADKTYGDNLSSYFIGNADRLGVLYVIWYRQIWLPSSGWMGYSGGNGDPSSDHTNHVHLSVY